MEAILSILWGSIGGAILAWLLRGWITERLKQSIQHEYAQKLETHKTELNSRLQTISHENQLRQLRMSLFFDHQREAFAKILTSIAEAKDMWLAKGFDMEGRADPIPQESYETVKWAVYNHQLFLDSDCIAAIDLVLSVMRDSFPIDRGDGELHYKDCKAAFNFLEFLQDRVAELFQQKIGLDVPGRAKEEVALLGAIRLVNRYYFNEIGLPAEGALCLNHRDTAAEALKKAVENRQELVEKLNHFREYLMGDPSIYHEVANNIDRYLRMLQT